MKKKYVLNMIILLFISLMTSYAQINVGGLPKSFSEKEIKQTVNFEKMSFVDVQKLTAEDETEDLMKNKPWRFGQNLFVNFDIKESGTHDVLKDGSHIWRLGIESEGALTVNLMFGMYKLPKGALLYVYNEKKTHVIGGFNNFNNQDDGIFATTLVTGDKIIIEYYEPSKPEFPGEILLNRVTHGYRGEGDYTKGFGSSGSCNMNVACPDGLPWEDDIRSSVMLVSGGNGFCSGALVNNTSEDGIPYILTANHCYSNPSSWVFWFNWESETCSNPGSSPGHNDISGATLKARNADSDFCLVLMNNTPPADYEVYYSGWDNSDDQPTDQVGIHHPSGDIKKISFDDDPAVSSDYDPNPYLADSHWEVTQWDRNTTTEPGSSGSPLYDQNHRIIGQLHGGWASCSSFTEDFYGKFSMSWDRGGSSSNQLKDWLDPTNSGATVLDGYDPNSPTVALDAQLLQISVPADTYFAEENITPTVTVKNKGTDEITSFTAKYKINEQAYVVENWSGTLASGETTEIVFPSIGIVFGSHTFKALVTAPNGGSDMNTENDTLIKVFNVVETIFNDDFETDEGWTMNGEWERNAPQGLGGEHGDPDPTSAYSGSNVLGLDLTGQGSYAGDYETNLGSHAEYAISPIIDCSNFENIQLSFRRWLGVEQASFDHAYIDVSNDGGSNWTELWANSATTSETAWGQQNFDISAYADEQAIVQIRFSIGSTDGSWQYCGWNIDDFMLIGISLTPTASVSATPGCGVNSGTVTVSSNKSGIQTFYLRDDAGSSINDWTGDATFYDFTGLGDGIYRGQVEKGGEMSQLSSPVTLTNDVTPVAPVSVSATETQICPGESTILSYTGGSGTTFTWYSESCGGTLAGAGNDLSVLPAATTTYYGRWENACGESDCENVTITVGTFTAITVQPDDVNANIGDNVSFTVVANGDNISYQWHFNGSDISGANTDNYSIDNVQISDAGNYDVSVSGDCGNETSDIAVLSVASNINDLSDFGIEVYPNPSNGIFNIIFPKDTKDVKLTVTDITGKIVYTQILRNPNINTFNINSGKGIYFLQLEFDDNHSVSKLIIN